MWKTLTLSKHQLSWCRLGMGITPTARLHPSTTPGIILFSHSTSQKHRSVARKPSFLMDGLCLLEVRQLWLLLIVRQSIKHACSVLQQRKKPSQTIESSPCLLYCNGNDLCGGNIVVSIECKFETFNWDRRACQSVVSISPVWRRGSQNLWPGDSYHWDRQQFWQSPLVSYSLSATWF